MNRREFYRTTFALAAMTSLSTFTTMAQTLAVQDEKMPVLFVGHGNPMNALEDNEFTKGWRSMVQDIPKPKAILCISAHWETQGTFVTSAPKPKTIHDFGGFPQALFNVQYPADGSVWLNEQVQEAVQGTKVEQNDEWGLDHGSWSVLKHMYPAAEVPVVELSLDYTKDAAYHYQLAKELQSLRSKGVLIIGSGNMVHNFQYARMRGDFNQHFGLDWALEANETFKKLIIDGNHKPLINYKNQGQPLLLSAPTPEHYLPLLYTLALQQPNEQVQIFNDAVVAGSFSMTSIKIG